MPWDVEGIRVEDRVVKISEMSILGVMRGSNSYLPCLCSKVSHQLSEFHKTSQKNTDLSHESNALP